MLRNDTIICGTSTTGAGTLTLAACPAPPGGVDLYAWLTATGLNFVSGNAVLVSYIIIEYSDTTFSQAKSFEKGVGTVTLGTGLTNSTLARSVVQSVASLLDSTGSPSYTSPSAFSIGAAANTLVFIGPSAAEMMAFSPFYETSLGDALGVPPRNAIGGTSGSNLISGSDHYVCFEWTCPMVVKRCTMKVDTAYSGGSSSLYARIYQLNSSGRPGKLLVDFGSFGTNPLNATGTISTTAVSTGFLLLPGEYVFDLMPTFSGGSGNVKVHCSLTALTTNARFGTSGLNPVLNTTASSGTAGAGPDPANLTSYAQAAGYLYVSLFLLNPS
jgi:hypothetical protein